MLSSMGNYHSGPAVSLWVAFWPLFGCLLGLKIMEGISLPDGCLLGLGKLKDQCLRLAGV